MERYSVWVRYGLALGAAGLAVFFRWLLVPVVGAVSPYLILTPIFMLTAFLMGSGPGLLAGLAGLAATEFWLIPLEKIAYQEAFWARAAVIVVGALFAGYFGRQLRVTKSKIQTQSDELSRLADQRHLALESAAIGTWDLKTEDSGLLCDDRCLSLFGMTRNPDVSTFLQMIYSEDRHRVEQAIARALDPAGAGDYHEEFRVPQPDGSLRWLQCDGRAHFTGRAWQRRLVRFTGIVMDTTERKRMETDLKGQKELFQSIVDNSPAMITLEGPRTTFRSNRTFHKILGWTDDDMLSRDRWEKLFPNPGYRREALKHLESPEAQWQDIRVTAKNGEMVESSWASIRLSDGSWVCLGIDLRERRQAEMALRESEERFRMLANNIAQIAWMATASGELFWVNQRWQNYAGKNLEEMQDQGWMQVVRPDFMERVVQKARECLENGREMEDIIPLRSREGNYRWFLIKSSPVRDASGKIRRWFGTGMDITEKQETEQALRDADRRKDEFLAMLAHELRNPLSPIRNAVAILRAQGPQDPVVVRQRELIDRQVTQMARILDDLLDVARIASGKIMLNRQRLSVDQLVRQALETANPLIESRHHSATLARPPESLTVFGDPVRLSQVVTNLLTNAAKYTPEGGKIWLGAGREGAEAVIRVRDNGQGIEPGMLGNIFDIFVQSHQPRERREGIGLGLAIVRNIVQLHGGRVEARSRGTGQGSEFIVYLPVAA